MSVLVRAYVCLFVCVCDAGGPLVFLLVNHSKREEWMQSQMATHQGITAPSAARVYTE